MSSPRLRSYHMAQFKVLSDRLADVTAGSTVDDMQLEGLNIEALIEGGHIEALGASKAVKKDAEEK
jgi:hypothetical protein